MPTRRAINIGLRSQAIIVLALMGVWYCSLILWMRDIKVGRLGLFWDAMFLFLPFIIVIFAAIMLVSFYRNGRPHHWWVQSAVVVVMTPWALFLGLLLAYL